MCPFCLASIGVIAASATSAGGLTALAVKLSRKKDPMKKTSTSSTATKRSQENVENSR